MSPHQLTFSAYIEEQEKALEYIRDSPDLAVDEKKRFFKTANTNLGKSVHEAQDFYLMNVGQSQESVHCACRVALRSDTVSQNCPTLVCVSVPVDHCGVVKAFLDAGLLPRVITG